MAIVALPDVIGAIVARLRSFPEITALVGSAPGYTAAATTAEKSRPRVSPTLQSFWAMPTYAIVVQGPVGRPAADDPDFGIHATRCDLHIYGPNPYSAMALWRIVEPALCPLPPTSRSFVQAGVRFGDVAREGGPTALVEPQTLFPKVVATYVFLTSGVAV